jgi:hypothetical protein
LTGRDLAANRADLLKASVEFGIDIGPPWLQCFEPYFFPDQVGGGAAPQTPSGLTVRPDPHNQSSVDGKVIFTGTTPLACGGLFIRIWRSTVRLRDLTVTPT